MSKWANEDLEFHRRPKVLMESDGGDRHRVVVDFGADGGKITMVRGLDESSAAKLVANLWSVLDVAMRSGATQMLYGACGIVTHRSHYYSPLPQDTASRNERIEISEMLMRLGKKFAPKVFEFK